jgi:FK506-binding nuclear protein
MAFWGCQIKPNKEAAFVPPPEASKLHISQACLAPDAPRGARAVVLLRVGDADPLAVCSLREGAAENCNLDLILDQYTEFSVQGGAAVHLTGYFMPDYELDVGGDGDEEDEEEEAERLALQAGVILGYDEHGRPVMADEYDSEEDSDYETEEDDEDQDGDGMFFSGEEDDSEGSEDFDSADEGPASGRKAGVVIEDITDAPTVSNRPAGRAAAAAFADDDVEGSDEEEEEEPTPAPKKAAGKKAANGAAGAGQKRKAGAEPAAAPAAEPQPKKSKKEKAEAKKDRKKAAKAAEASPAAEPSPRDGAAGLVPSGKKHVRRFANGFEIEEVSQGRGAGKVAAAGKRVSVRYVGRLKTGAVFDQTSGARTFSFRLGVGEVIKGWDRGVEGMRVGDTRRLVVPPAMAYGSARTGPIPPNSTLTFEVELVDVKG